MPKEGPKEPITGGAAEEAVNEIDAWQTKRIQEGREAARAGRARLAEAVFDDIASKHGWER